MRKIYLLFAMLLCSVGTWAAVITTTPVAGTEYYIKCIATDHTGNLADDGTTLQGRAATGTKFVLEATGTEGQYYIKSVTSNKYINAAGNTTGSEITFDATATTYWTLDQTNADTSKNSWAIRPNGTAGVSLNNNGSSTATCPYMKVNVHSNSGQGCDLWTFDDGTVEATSITTVEEMTDGHIYTLTTNRNSIIYNGTTATGGTLDASLDNHKFVAVKNGTTAGRFYLYNIGAKKYIAKKAEGELKLTDTPEQYWTIKTGGNQTGKPMMIDAQDGTHFNFGGSSQIVISSWSTADEGNSFAIIERGEADEELIAEIKATYTPKTSTDANTYWYTIKNFRSSNYAAWTADDTQITQVAEAALSKKAYWYLKDGKLYNAATTNAYASTSSFTETGATVYVKENPYNATYFCISTTENLSSNCWDDNNGNVGTWQPSASDYEGTSWTFVPVDYTPASGSINVTLTDAAGNVMTATVGGNENDESSLELTGAYNYTLTNVVWNGSNMTADIAFEFKTSKTDGTKVATTLQSQIGNGSKWYAKDGKLIADQASSTKVYSTTADNYRWYIYPALSEDGQFTFQLYNVGAQKYIPAEAAANSWTATTLSETAGSYCYSHINTGNGFNKPGTQVFLSVNTSGDAQNVFQWTFNGTSGHVGSNMSFPELTVQTSEQIETEFAAMQAATKFTIEEGAEVIYADELGNTPADINAAIEAAESVDETEEAKIAFITGDNGKKIAKYLSALANYNSGKLTNIVVTVKANKFGTICLPCNGLTATSDFKVYTCSAVDGSTLTLNDHTTYMVQNTPYIVKNETEDDMKFQFIGWDYADGSETKSAGYLTGVLTEDGVTVPADSYVLAIQKSTGKQAFYHVESDVKCPQYKCYLTVSETSGVKAFYFPETGEETAIENVLGKTENTAIYNLAGQKLSKLQKGINIVNGKKIMVK